MTVIPVAAPSGPTIILIVTPTFNSARFLDETIVSVVSQSGDFHLRYHIQDGGSTDATMRIVRRWDRLLRSGFFPVLCASLVFTYDSRPDGGMYQAINRGVTGARPDAPFVMSWINSDDRLAPGALAAIHSIYDQFADVCFTCARVSMIDRHGVVTGINLPIVYDRQRLATGLHDGRSHSFVMQEGTFWRSSLWDAVNGLDEGFRLSGDWDLWRRFAHHAALFTVDSVLAFHRRHDQQLSADLSRYYAEVDAANVRPGGSGLVGAGISEVLRFDLDARRWQRRKSGGTPLAPPIVHNGRGVPAVTYRVELTRGARLPEGPYPEVNLPGGMRWIDDERAEAVVVLPHPGRWRMHLRIRNWRSDLRLRVMCGETLCLDVMPGAGEDDRDTLLTTALWLAGGSNTLRIVADGDFGTTPGWLFVVLDWYVMMPFDSWTAVSSVDPPTDVHWPAIAVVVCVSGAGRDLDRRLAAVLEQGYPAIDLGVVDRGAAEVNRQILGAYAPAIDRVVTPADGNHDDAVGRAIDLGRGDVIVVLDDDARLAPQALFAVAEAFRQAQCDLVAGVTVDEGGSRPRTRCLPLLADGPLLARELERIAEQRGGAAVFDRGALFFTRRIWAATGRLFTPATFSLAAVDFWSRCAEAGATLVTLPVDLVRRVAGADIVRRSAEGLVAGRGVIAQGPRATRAGLKIVLVDAAGIARRPGEACDQLAKVLAAAGQRVVCIVDDGGDTVDQAGAAAVAEVIKSEGPDLVVFVGNTISSTARDVVAELLAGSVPTLRVRQRRPRRAGFDLARVSGGDGALAEPFGVLVYGDGGDRSAPKPTLDATVRHGLAIAVDTTLYRPNRRGEARRILGLATDAFIVLGVSDGSAGASSRLVALVHAYEALASAAKLLLILGQSSSLPLCEAAIVAADDLATDDLRALFYAAADVVVSLLGERAALPLVRAAASGTPAIVRGSRRAAGIDEGPFGLRLAAWTAGLLGDALQRLRINRELVRRLATSGRARAVAHHSLTAGAWSFLTLAGQVPAGRRLYLRPVATFPSNPPVVALRPLQGTRARPASVPRWAKAGGPHGAARGDVALQGSATIYLRAQYGGPQHLHLRAAGRGGTIAVTLRVNGDDCAAFAVAAAGGAAATHIVRADFFRGVNRIDLAIVGEPTACLQLQSLALDEDGASDDGTGHDWQPLIGFAEMEAVDGRGPHGRWMDGPSASLRLWSPVAGARHLRLALKNYGAPCTVAVTADGVAVAQLAAPTTDFVTASKLRVAVTVRHGWTPVSLTIAEASPTGFGRALRIIVSHAELAAPGDSPQKDAD